MSRSRVRVTASVVVLALLPAAILAQTQCSLPGSEEPQHGNNFVQPILECESDGPSFQLNHSYPDGNLGDSSMQMFYECTDVFGNVTNKLIHWAYDKTVARSPRWGPAYPVDNKDDKLSSSFKEPGASCQVYGCYRLSTVETNNHYLIQNATCEYPEATTPPPTTEPTTPSPATVPTDPPTPPGDADPHPTPSSTGSKVSMAAQVMHSYDVTSPQATVTTNIPQPTPIPTPDSTSGPSMQSNPPEYKETLAGILVFIFILVAVIIVVTVVIGVLLKARHNQRRKHFILRYYNYSEPIDPYFSPVDVNPQIKTAVSIMSVFDPLPLPVDSSDDDKSVVLPVTNPLPENASLKSMVFHDEAGEGSSEHKSEKTDQEETTIPIEEPNKINLNQDQAPSKSLHIGYVPANYSIANGRTTQATSSPMPRGYIMEQQYKPSAMPLQGVQPQAGNKSVGLTHNMSLSWTQNNQAPEQLTSPTSSGYVSELHTPSDNQRQLSKIGVTPVTSLSKRTYSTLDNGYAVAKEEARVTTPPVEDSHSVVYNLEEGVESVTSDCEGVESDCEGVRSDCVGGESVWEQMYVENIVAECSLSLNPLHFEPVDDLIPEQTSPSYVNTSASDQFFSSTATY